MAQSGGGGWDQWDAYADQLRSMLPEVPSNIRDAYVKYAPVVAIVVGGLGVLAWLMAVSAGLELSRVLLLAGAAHGGLALLTGLVGLASAGLQVVGGIWMRSLRLAGWWLLAVGLAVTLLNRLVHFSIIGVLVAAAIVYVHLRVKPAYA